MAFSVSFLGGFIVHMLLSGFLLVTFLRYRKLFPQPRIGYLFGVLALPYMILALVELSWLLDLIAFLPSDLYYIYSLVSIAEAVLLVLLVYGLLRNSNILFLFFLYGIVILGASLKMAGILTLILGMSYLMILFVCIDIMFFTNRFLQKAGIFGSLHAASFLVLLIFLALGSESALSFAFLSDAFLFVALFFLFISIKRFGIQQKARKEFVIKEKFSDMLFFIRFFLYIIIISVFLFVSILATHELGHAVTAEFFGCPYSKAVIYDVLNPPHTEIQCSNAKYATYITLAGLMFTVLLSLLFLLVGDQFAARAAYLMLGYSLIMVYGDFTDLAVSGSLILVTMLVAFFFICLGVVLLSLYYINQHIIKGGGKRGGEPKSINASSSQTGQSKKK